MSRWIEFRIDKPVDDVIVKGSLRAAINGLVFEMNDPIDGISYRGHHIPTFALPYYRYIEQGNLSDYGISESEELMEKACKFIQFIRNNGEYARQLFETYNKQLNILESQFCNVTMYTGEKSKARRLLKAGLITSRHCQYEILKKLTSEHTIYIQKVNELRFKYNTILALKIGHFPTYSCEELENFLRYFNKLN